MEIKKYRKMLERPQRLTSIRICSGYRTISGQKIGILASRIPIDLLAEEKAFIKEN